MHNLSGSIMLNDITKGRSQMIRSRLVLAWYARLMRREEDPALCRFGRLRIDQPNAPVPLFYARKAA
jgi:hypothetical protein